MTSTTLRAASAVAPGNGRARQTNDETLPPDDGVSFETVVEWDELSATCPAVPRSFGVRLKAGAFKAWTREGDIAVVSPTATVESGKAALAWLTGRGAVLSRVRIERNGIVKFIPEDITQPAITANPGDIAWMLRVTALHHSLS